MKGSATTCGFFLLVSAYLLLIPFADAQNQASQAELNTLNQRIAGIRSQIESNRRQQDDARQAVEESERSIAGLNQQILALENRISAASEELQQLQTQRGTLETERQAQQTLIAQYLRSAYRSGREEYLKLLLNQQSISQSARSLRYYQYFSAARTARIEDFNNTLQQLAEVEADIISTGERLDAERNELLNRQADLQTQQSQRQALLAELNQALNADERELQRLQTERDEMEQLLEELARAITELPLGEAGQPFAELRGRLPWPVNGPLLNRYGARYALGDLNWQGVVIAADPGTDVRAIHHGRVIFADWFGNSGLLLIIDHGDAYMSLYAHNQLLYKEAGDWVTAGEVIAAVGNTGGRPEHGVYFEIRHNGNSQNPQQWCVSR